MAIFGSSKGSIVIPRVEFHDGTLLSSKRYTVTSTAMYAMGFSLSSIEVPGGEYSANFNFNCPFNEPDSKQCRMSVYFEEDVDTIVRLESTSRIFRQLPDSCMEVGFGCRTRSPMLILLLSLSLTN